MNLTTCLAELKALAVKTIEDCTFEKTVTYFGKAETARVLLPYIGAVKIANELQ